MLIGYIYTAVEWDNRRMNVVLNSNLRRYSRFLVLYMDIFCLFFNNFGPLTSNFSTVDAIFEIYT